MLDRITGFLIRREACRLAALAAQGQWAEGRAPGSMLWSLAVFFEEYMRHGAKGTREDFGPHEPVDLGIVRAPKNATGD